MPFVPTCLTCLSASSAYVPTCLLALNYYVPTGFTLKLLHTYFPSFFAYLCANLLTCLYIFFVPLCLRVLYFFLPTCAHLSRAYVPTTTHKIYWGSLLYIVLFLLKLHTSILTCGVLLSQVVHGQRQQFEDPLRNYLKQWTVSSVLSS